MNKTSKHKTARPQPSGGGNQEKRQSYTLAFRQIGNSIKAGFPIEAIALEESILADRLESAVSGKGLPLSKKPRQTTPAAERRPKTPLLSKLLDTVAENESAFATLRKELEKKGLSLAALDEWKDKRNDFIHNVVHAAPERKPNVDATTYLEEGRKVAELGRKLACAVCTWSSAEVSKRNRSGMKDKQPATDNHR